MDAADLGAILGAVGAVLVLVARKRAELALGFAVLVAAEIALIGSFAVGDRLLAPGAIALGLVGLAVLAAGATVFVRHPAFVTPAILAAAPFRLPLDFGREHRFFVAVAEPGQLGRLLLLYAVLGAAVLALLWRMLRNGPLPSLPRQVGWPAGAFIAFASLSLLWTVDLRAGENLLAYFLLPFAVLVAVVARAPAPTWLPKAMAWIAVGLGAVFALVGLVQEATGKLFFYAPNLEISNTYGTYFRVTSLFRDPSLYGRHLVLAIAVVLVAVWLRRINVWFALAAIVLLWFGLFFSYSQSSFVALFTVVLAVTAFSGDRRIRIAVAGTAAAVVIAGAALVAIAAKDASAQRASSDRTRRVEVTFDVFKHRPIAGVGIGGQPRASQRQATRKAQVTKYVSHTTPLTIAAELGIAGLLLYGLVLAGAVWLVDRVRRRDVALGLGLGAVLLALFVHSLFYSGFFEDPITWLALAVGASFLASGRTATLAR